MAELSDLEKKIISIAEQHAEYNQSVALEEIEKLREYGVTQHLLSLYTGLIQTGPGDINPLNSFLAYYLGITTAKPTGVFTLVKRRTYGRSGFPDIDMDFDYLRRHEIVEYLIEKYGRDRVAGIGAVQKIKTKAALHRVIKALDPTNSVRFKDGKIDKNSNSENIDLARTISKTLPKVMKTDDGEIIDTVQKAYDNFPEFKKWMDNYPEVMRFVAAMEGKTSGYSKHAGGIVLSAVPLNTICPLHYTVSEGIGTEDKKEKTITTMYSMGDVESLGLIKFDILGISTKTSLSWCVDTVKANKGKTIDLSNLPLDDKPTLDLLDSGMTTSVFQCEGHGMQNTLRKIGVDHFNDIVNTIAMFRPGPMQYIDDLADRKHGRSPISYAHPLMKTLTEDTWGIIIFQETLMKVFMVLANLSASDGYDFMKGCAKKKPELIAKYRSAFVKGSINNGIEKEIVLKIFSDMQKFAQYCFNRSHSVSYGLETFKTAYLKAHYPTEFIESRLSVENIRRKFDAVDNYETDAIRNFGFKIHPPDINKSTLRYKIIGERELMRPILIKGVGYKAATNIVNNQPYKGSDLLYSFGMKTGKQVTVKVMEAMYDGGLWSNYKSKKKLLADFEIIKNDKRKSRGQMTDDIFE